MCGIFGFTFKKGTKLISNQQVGMLTYLLAILNDKRGGDSWGFVGIDNNQNLTIDRGLGDVSDVPWKLLGYKKLMAHTRYATKGSATIANAHPFEIGRIIGAHNGMIYNHESIAKSLNRECPVDSMHLFHHINEGKDFDDLNGYGTIEWIEDKDPSTIYLCQLHNGDLSVYGLGTHGGQIDGVIWSSDYRHLEMALKLTNLRDKTFKYTIQQGQVYYANEGGLFYAKGRTYSLNNNFKFSYGNTPKAWRGYMHDDSEWGYNRRHQIYNGASGPYNSIGNTQNREADVISKPSETDSSPGNVISEKEKGNWDWQEWNNYCLGDYTGKKSTEEEEEETEKMLRLFQG